MEEQVITTAEETKEELHGGKSMIKEKGLPKWQSQNKRKDQQSK